MGMISEEKLTEAFVKAFKDVVEPGLNVLTDKVDVLTEDMGDVKERLGKIEDKLVKIDDRLDRQGKSQENLEKRVGVLESASVS